MLVDSRVGRARLPLPIVEEHHRVIIKPIGTVGRLVVVESLNFSSLVGANSFAERQLEMGLAVQMTRLDGLWRVVVMAVDFPG